MKAKKTIKAKKDTKPRWGFHGEVLFEESPLPSETKLLKSVILQKSATQGHDHIVKKGKFELRQLAESAGDRLFLVAKKGVIIGMSGATERHEDVKIPDNTVWEICPAIETDHIARVIRAVTD